MGRPRISLTIPPDMMAEIDSVRGLVPRERWIRAAIHGRLRTAKMTEPGLPPVERRHSGQPTTMKDSVTDVTSTFSPPSTPQDRRLAELATEDKLSLTEVIDAAGLVPASSLTPTEQKEDGRPW